MPRNACMLLMVMMLLMPAGAGAAVDGVSVRLSPSQPREIDLVTGERFQVGATATLLCATGSVSTPLAYHVLRRDALGHEFDPASIFDYDSIKRRGRVIETSPEQRLTCNRPASVLHAGLRAPGRPGQYYLSVCFPPLARDGSGYWPNAGPEGNPSNCTQPVTLRVGPRPAPDLVIRSTTLEPAAEQYEAGQEVALTATVRNAGSGNSRRTRLEFVRVSQPDGWGGAGLTLATRDVPALEPGEEAEIAARTTTPPVGGVYYVEACVKPAGRGTDARVGDGRSGPEAYVDNNCSDSLSLRVGRSTLPRVRIASLLVEGGSVQARRPVETQATIAHAGDGDAFVGDIVLLQRKAAADVPAPPAASGQAADDYTERARGSVRLEPGETLTRDAALSAPPKPGRYQLVACLASEGVRFGCSDPVEIRVR